MKEKNKAVLLDLEVAKEIGVNPAIVVCRLYSVHEWSKKYGYGKWIDGVHYVYNTYKQWREDHFGSVWSLTTTKNIFQRLVDDGILFRRKYWKGWDQTRGWALNYSHPIVKKLDHAIVKKVDDGTVKKVDHVINTDTYPNKTANTTSPVVEPKFPSGETPYSNRTRTKQTSSKGYGEIKDLGIAQKEYPDECKSRDEDYPHALKWKENLDEIYRDRVEQYIKNQKSNPKILNPIGYERYVTSQVWRVCMGMPNHCDFVPPMGTDDKEIQTVQVVYETEEQRTMRIHDIEESPEVTMERDMQNLMEELHG